MEFTKDTRLADVLDAYPELKNKLPEIDPRLKLAASPMAKMLLGNKTFADAGAIAGMDPEELISELKKLLELE